MGARSRRKPTDEHPAELDQVPSAAAEGPPVLTHRDGAVATILINRPRRHNALDRVTKAGLVRALRAAAVAPDVRAVVVGGAGPSFSVGQDLAEHASALHAAPEAAFATISEHYAPMISTLMSMPKPTIAAVRGLCAGAALGMVLACDLRVVADDTRFMTAFAGIGLASDSGLALTLSAAVGSLRARDLLLTGRTFTAQEASEWGIPAEVGSAETVDDRAHELAHRFAEGPTLAYAAVKQLLVDAQSVRIEHVMQQEWAAQTRLGETDDHRAAVAAFLAKNRPSFEGR